MSSSFFRLALLFSVLGSSLLAEAQGTNQASTSTAPDATHFEQVPRVPGVGTLLRGLNAGVTFSGVHDSSIGWYTVATPAISYTFSPRYSADVSFSVYPSREVESQDREAHPSQQFVLTTGELSDTFIGVHASFDSRLMRNTATGSFTIPTGDDSAGLGAGKVTFDFSDRMERVARKTGLLLDIGAGNSSSLFNRVVTSNYTSVGTLAHFQEGVVFWPFSHNYIQCVAYQQLPIGSQTLYTNPGASGSTAAVVSSGSGLGHDNGVTTLLGIPLTAHLTFSSYYNRSFEQNLDTVSTGITYVLRGRSEFRWLSKIDKALREAERVNDQPHQ